MHYKLCMFALLKIVIFSWLFVISTYIVAQWNMPLIDNQLSTIDSLLHFSTKNVVDWSLQHPHINWLLTTLYDTLLIQTGLTIWWLGMNGQEHVLDQFVRNIMVGGLITLGLFILFPAIGPLPYPDASQQFYLNTFHTLRSGTMCDLRHTTGLITFPSFHVVWALILVAACPRKLKPVSVLLNGLIIVSTISTGWHYGVDVLGGIAVYYLTRWVSK